MKMLKSLLYTDTTTLAVLVFIGKWKNMDASYDRSVKNLFDTSVGVRLATPYRHES